MKYAWAERLDALRIEKGWPVAELHRRVVAMFPNNPISKDSIHKYLRGEVEKPRGDVLQRLAAVFGKNELWLLYGDTVTNVRAQTRIPLLSLEEVASFEPNTRLDAWKGSSVVAGEDDTDLVAVKLTDDSCAPEIKRGSTVFCKLTNGERVEPGSLVVAKVPGLNNGVCRKYRATNARDRRQFKLIAINPDYPDIEASEQKPVTIFGTVVRVLSNYP